MLEMMDGLLEKGKITIEDYNLMATAIENLAVYLYGRYIKGNKISKEVSNMVKTFIDPKMVIVYKSLLFLIIMKIISTTYRMSFCICILNSI